MKAGFTALLLLLLALVIRIAIAVQGIHGTDVLAHVNGTRSLLLTGSPYCRAYYNYPPLYSVIQLPTILMFGWNSLGYKFMPVLFDTLLSIALYMAVKRVVGSEKLALAVQLLLGL
jgi:4-amino-4-deoxy-L-arabinose transferase-like glycosyltransferase